ncbi:MAG: hypothetical protein WCD79_01825 [Chthoniobacteraceae bacterium]
MNEAQAQFGYSEEEIVALEAAISASRLRPYLVASDHNRINAIKLYERNVLLSEALYGPLQAVEIVVRNAMHRELSRVFGNNWPKVLVDSGVFEYPQLEKLESAMERLGKINSPQTTENIISEVSFGFWTSICAVRFMHSLWIPCLRKSFKIDSLSRKEAFERLDEIRTLRNLVAHHSPILGRDLEKDYQNILQTIGWVCETSKQWVKITSCFKSRFTTS